MRGDFRVRIPEEAQHEARAADTDGVDGATVSHAVRNHIVAFQPKTSSRLVRDLGKAAELLECLLAEQMGVPLELVREADAFLLSLRSKEE